MELPKTASILDLPVDIIIIVLSLLDARSFLHFTSCCRALHDSDVVHDSSYWSSLVRREFRVPQQILTQRDGRRWQKLYKRLRTQSRIYTWGNNEKGCLGHAAGNRPQSRWPEEMVGARDLGVVSDLQCGGWSTTILTSNGSLHTVGVLDGLPWGRPINAHVQQVQSSLSPLNYPSGFQRLASEGHASTAIRQFSSGRSHVLGLSDSGRIWTWQNASEPAVAVKFLFHETLENVSYSRKGAVQKVVAGWNKSAALIAGVGIVLWDVVLSNPISDVALITESAIVPGTASISKSEAENDLPRQGAKKPEDVEERKTVQNFIVLSDTIIFVTKSGKLFAAKIVWTEAGKQILQPVELDLLSPTSSGVTYSASDVQGSHQSFAVFSQDGAVFTSDQDRVMRILNEEPLSIPLFSQIPALQNQGVISVAFGDYHYHALHSAGYITSYGHEPRACGALGLGGDGDPEGRLRGIRYDRIGGDGKLLPHAYIQGRRVWFERVKRAWIKFLTSGGVDPQESAERVRLTMGHPDPLPQGEVSDWIEQEGRDWIERTGLQSQDEDNFGAYFALSVAAAGWHSGALVLVNDSLVKQLNAACEVNMEMPPSSSASDGSLATAEGTTEGVGPEAESVRTSPLYNSLIDLGRRVWGLRPEVRDRILQTSHESSQVRNHRPLQSYGASPRPGVLYRWAGDHFPRLTLSDGRLMPGTTKLSAWRYGRPEWKAWQDWGGVS